MGLIFFKTPVRHVDKNDPDPSDTVYLGEKKILFLKKNSFELY